MPEGKRAQAGTVLPICLLFLFLIAQLTMSAVETAALNQAMVASLKQTDDVNRVEHLAFQQAFQQVFRHVSQHGVQNDAEHAPRQPATLPDSFPLEVSGEVAFPDVGAETLTSAFRFRYRIEAVDESTQAAYPVPWEGPCDYLHRVDVAVYGW